MSTYVGLNWGGVMQKKVNTVMKQINQWLSKQNKYMRQGFSALIKHTWLKWLFVMLMSITLLSVIGFSLIIYGGGLVVNERDMVLPATTKVVTEEGAFAGRLYTENRMLVSLDDIPDHVVTAFLATEDERFYDHAGVDFRSVLRAVYRDIIAFDKVEGASTITQQLSKNLFLDQTQSWMRKTKEVMASLYLERNYTKDELLALYLNEIYFAHGIHGVGTASNYFFGKDVGELSITEGAMLAGMIKGPNLYSPYIDETRALARRNVVLGQLARVGYLDTEELLRLEGKSLGVQTQPTAIAPYLDDYLEVVIREVEARYNITRSELQRGGYTITVHMDETMQQTAYQEVQKASYFKGSNDAIEASVVMLEPSEAKVKAIVGGRDYTIGETHQALTRRQPGSVIKPLAVYTPALEEGFHPYSLLWDEQGAIEGYTVRNANGEYQGEVSMVEALTQSKNTSAVWLLNQLGIEKSKQYLSRMHLSLPDDGLAIALGGLTEGYTPIDVANAYSVYLNEGSFNKAMTIEKLVDRNGKQIDTVDSDSTNVFSAQSTWYTLEMLERVVSEGTGSVGEYSGALAGKTGTTQHPVVAGQAKDAWFVGLTPELVTATWIGYDRSDDAHYLTAGSSQATELTKGILTRVNEINPFGVEFVKPQGVEDLPEPIELPRIQDLSVDFSLGGFNLFQAELTWSISDDDRIIYRIYQVTEEGTRLVGQTEGKGSYTINRPSILQMTRFYVEPFNPLINEAGERSNVAMLSLFD